VTDVQPTSEQDAVLDLFDTDENLVVQAGAGTGKTTTLKLIGEQTPRRGQYLAFNRAIVDEAKRKMPRNIRVSTIHSLAFGAVGKHLAHRIDSRRMPSTELARRLDLGPLNVKTEAGVKVLQPGYLAGLTMRTITQFCSSADPEPSARHKPYVDGLDMPDATGRRTFAVNDLVALHIEPALKKAWEDVTRPDGVLPFRHEHYLKLWERSEPRIGAEFILYDEAQDVSPVMESIVNRQSCQKVYVGDSQQAIYEWMGAIDAMDRAEAAFVTYLRQSFRFGWPVADVANELLYAAGADLQLRGFDQVTSVVEPFTEPADVVLCRTNAEAVAQVLGFQTEGRTVHLVGGSLEVLRFAEAAMQLKETGSTGHPELACFDSWGAVQDYVEQDEQGIELKLLVKLIDEFSPEVIIKALGDMPEERCAEVVVSTAHRSKGREWPRVRLAGDFPDTPERFDQRGEIRLLYVACTRAQHALDLTAVPYFQEDP
jgi:hypothetical protein